MATENVLNWITRDMKLSKTIESFETDFSNGYLFGEILNRYQLIDDLSNFSKKTGKEAKVKNFQQVERVLRELKVKFDGKLVHQIMNEERGASLRLLYQLKLAIEKSDIGGIDANKMTMSNLKPEIVNRKMEETLNLKATLPLNNTNRLATINGSKKLAPIEKHMLPFEHRKFLLEEKARRDQKAEEDLIMRMRMDARDLEFSKMQENKEFMNEWLVEGKQNWRKNQDKRADAIARVKYFEDREVKIYKDRLAKELDEATKELIGGVDEFEKNLQKLGIEKNTNIEEAIKKMEEKKGVPPGQIQNFSYAATMNKIKEKKNVQEFAAKERDRRRRKMLVDQSKTQSELDRKKNEELLIEKLLAQQAQEHKLAYLDRRAQQCKEIIVDARRQRALQFEEKKVSQIQQIEEKRNEQMPELIEKHKRDFQDKKREYTVTRREEKASKRRVNQEICSEIIDLIMDLSNEAFNETQSKGKISKPVWREWMKYFKDNQLVSRARKGLLQGGDTFLMATDASAVEEQFDVLDDPKMEIQEVLEAMKYDQAYEDLLQYLSVSGIFNVSNGDFQEWFDIKSLLEGTSVNNQFLQYLIPPQNPALGKMLLQLLKENHITSKTNVEAENEQVEDRIANQTPVAGIPNHLTLKLCLLGKSCAGKKTIAKQIQDQYPAGKVKVYKMDDLIKEVVEYINPKPVADLAAQDKTKKAPPAKGKVEEAQPTDPFAGLDTKEYKEIGHQIKKFIGEGELPQGQDLTSLIPDDSLLVNLFIQKLKLTFPSEKSEAAKIEEIKANMAKEKEILDQLAELEAANSGQDPKGAPPAKGGKAPPPKKGAPGGPSGEEQLKADLELVTKIQPEGWILLDFPRTLAQAKRMEYCMSNGYTCMTDKPKDQADKLFEQWSKLVTPASTIANGDEELQYNETPYLYKSATDGYLFLNVKSEECYRRVSNRKIDPTTGTIYHLEDNPPPEGDAKLKDRLQDYVAEGEQEASRMQHNHRLYEANAPELMKWASSFGLRDDSSPQIEPVTLLMNVTVQPDTRPKKEEVFENVQKTIGQIIAFKQAQYEVKKQRVREQMEKEATIQNSQSQEQIQHNDAQNNADQQQNLDKVSVAGSRNNDVKSMNNTQQSKHSASQGSILVSQNFSQKQFINLTDEQKIQLWRKFEAEYYRECLQVFRQVKKQRSLVFDGLTQMQSQFIDTYLQRIDSRQASLVHDFIESYTKFSEEFPNLRSDPQTQEELNKRLTRLSNEMWTLVEQKKDLALAQHSKLNQDGWVVNEMKKLMKNACIIIQCEVQRTFIIYSLVTGVKNSLEIELERTFDNYSDDGFKTIDESEKSPVFDKVFSYVIRIIAAKYDQLTAVEDLEKRHILKNELDSLMFKLNSVKTWVMLKAKEFNQFWRQLYEVLDNAIITAIKLENEATQSVISRIGDYMNAQAQGQNLDNLTYQDVAIPYIDLEEYIQRIDFSNADVPLYLQNITIPDNQVYDMRLKISMLKALYRNFRFHAYEEFLDGQTFIHQIVLAFQQNRVPTRWRYFEYRVFNQLIQKLQVIPPITGDSDLYEAQSKREFLNWKTLLTMFTLLVSPLADKTALEEYEQGLINAAEGKDSITIEKFTSVPTWFDDFEVLAENPPPRVTSTTATEEEEDPEEEAERNRDRARLQQIKGLLYQIHQTNTKTLVISDFISRLQSISLMAEGYSTFHGFLFGE